MKIFVILPRIPFPLEKGDKLRAFHQIRCLSKNNEIILCAINDTKIHKDARKTLQKYCTSIHFFSVSKFSIIINVLKAFLSGKPFQVGYFYNSKAKKKIDDLIKKHKPDHIYCQLIRVAEYVKDQDIPKTIDYQDVFSKGLERRIHSAPFYLKPVFRIEYNRVLNYERTVFDSFDNKTIISIPDRDLISHPEKDKIEIIINGVDTDYFFPIKMKKEYDLVFTGNMAYPPNAKAAVYIVKKILPIVHKTMPDVNLLLAGASPDKSVLSLDSEKVTVAGWVDDMRESYAKAKIFIAPMQIGTGLQNKLLEAMAMRIPSITSKLANNALGAKPGKEILLGSSPDEYASHIIDLLRNPIKAEKLAENGYKYIINNYNWESATAKLEELMIGK